MITLGEVQKALTPRQKGRLVRDILGDDAFDPWERLKDKRARGMNVEPERRYLMATTPPQRKAKTAVSRGLDRVGQSTATENMRDQHFASLLAIAVANWERLDWSYIDNRIAEIAELSPALGKSMRTMHRRGRRIARNALAKRRAKLL